MPANYVLLQSIELTASAASVTFSNIPQSGYTDLKVVFSLRSTATETNSGYYDALLTRFNSSTSNYSGREIYAYQNTAYSGTLTTATSTIAGGTWGRLTGVGVNNSNSSATASTFTSIDLYLPNYTSSNYKSYSFDLAEEQNASYSTLGMTAGLWSDTTAISNIAFALKDGSFAQYSTFSLYGLAAVGTTPVIAPKASGGNTVTTDGTYWYHTFRSSGYFIPSAGLTCDYLVVAGGGSGGNGSSGGGGGAGGLRSTVTATGGGGSLESALSLSAQRYTVIVGGGGALSGTQKGSDSTFATITSAGGGGCTNIQVNMNGGSGAGAPAGGGPPSSYLQGTGTANQGYGGGAGWYTSSNYPAGGGGGAGAVGGSASSNSQAGNGGVGVAVAISGSSVYYAGGGGGGGQFSGSAGAGGNGGGGAGSVTINGTAGTTNTGGGGGGCGYDGTARLGGAGGSGIVIIRYAV